MLAIFIVGFRVGEYLSENKLFTVSGSSEDGSDGIEYCYVEFVRKYVVL